MSLPRGVLGLAAEAAHRTDEEEDADERRVIADLIIDEDGEKDELDELEDQLLGEEEEDDLEGDDDLEDLDELDDDQDGEDEDDEYDDSLSPHLASEFNEELEDRSFAR
jgi:rubrerythrin